MTEHGATSPLLPTSHHHHGDNDDRGAGAPPQSPAAAPSSASKWRSALGRHVARLRQTGRRLLSSRKKHFGVMVIVTLDVAVLLANIFLRLIACEMHQTDEPWVQTVTGALETAGLLVSSLFMIELAACLFSYGLGYLSSWFHAFDAAVIVVSFVIDVSFKGLAESIGSLVVVLRLWRLAKISEEVVVGATERMEMLEQHIDELETENKHLRMQLGQDWLDHSGHE
ncbi:hypothetical protein HIM_02105 [Hirsutella minnesotensis 3608]|nr:hypothetical protein HIM_02105 [Hirsutella minnesotensis 3608]